MIVALVSGGVDSVVLLHRLVRGGADVVVLHVDHGLRPGAASDAAFVRGLHHDVRVVALDRAPGRAGNVQAWARAARYRAAFALADELGGCDVATGHTASDQVEGVLYRLAAAPGRRALLGMRARSGRLVRPLLDWTRADVEAYAREHRLGWREDPSNAAPTYARNRARAALVPALRQLHPAAERNVLATLAVLRDEAQVLEDQVADALVRCGFDGASVSADGLAALAPALARLTLQALADRAVEPTGVATIPTVHAPAPGARGAPPIGGRLPELLALGGGTKGLDLGGGLRAVATYGRLSIVAGDVGAGPPFASTDLPVPGRTRFLGGAVEARRLAGVWPRHRDVLDVGARPLTLRTRRPGDRMRPLHLGGSKSLQDLFVDRKVPAAERDAWPVVCAGEEIVWVPHVATGHGARVTAATTAAVGLHWDRLRCEPA